MEKKGFPIWRVLSGFFSFASFLILVYAIRYLTGQIPNPIFSSVGGFIDNNLPELIVMSLLFFIAEIFSFIKFPINLVSPILYAAGSTLLLDIIFKIMALLEILMNQDLFKQVYPLAPLAYYLVFLLVLFGGCFFILAKRGKAIKEEERQKAFVKEDALPKEKSWRDIGKELRSLIGDVVYLIRLKTNRSIEATERKRMKKRLGDRKKGQSY